jgi:hypothetical protein
LALRLPEIDKKMRNKKIRGRRRWGEGRVWLRLWDIKMKMNSQTIQIKTSTGFAVIHVALNRLGNIFLIGSWFLSAVGNQT